MTERTSTVIQLFREQTSGPPICDASDPGRARSHVGIPGSARSAIGLDPGLCGDRTATSRSRRHREPRPPQESHHALTADRRRPSRKRTGRRGISRRAGAGDRTLRRGRRVPPEARSASSSRRTYASASPRPPVRVLDAHDEATQIDAIKKSGERGLHDRAPERRRRDPDRAPSRAEKAPQATRSTTSPEGTRRVVEDAK